MPVENCVEPTSAAGSVWLRPAPRAPKPQPHGGRSKDAWTAATLDILGDAVLAVDTAGEIVLMNRAAEDLTGWVEADARGQMLLSVLYLYDDESGAPARNPIFDLQSGQTRICRLAARDGGSVRVEVACHANYGRDEWLGSIIVLRNAEIQHERDQRRIESARMDALASMAGGIASELAARLECIADHAGDLCAKLAGADARQALEILQATRGALRLSTHLNAMSRQEAVVLTTFDLNEAIDEILLLLPHSLGTACPVELDLSRSAGFVRGDRDQIKQMILYLASRPRDPLPSAAFRIHTEIVEVNGSDPGLCRSGRYVRLRISDGGAAADSRKSGYPFEPDFGSGGQDCATGLELAIVHAIVMQNHGYIQATSEETGVSYEILLPCVGAYRRDVAGSPPAILLVDPDETLRRRLHARLEREGFHLIEAADWDEAALIAELHREPIPLVLTDMATSPDLDTTSRVQNLRPETQVLFVPLGDAAAEADLVHRLRQLIG